MRLSDYRYYKCPKCRKDVCIKHRFADLHDCDSLKKKPGLFDKAANDQSSDSENEVLAKITSAFGDLFSKNDKSKQN